MMSLTFKEYTEAMRRRSDAVWPNCKSWDARDWIDALDGEVGEVKNILKKMRRDGFSEELWQRLWEELGDVIAYGFLTIDQTGADPEEVTIQKFNKVSEKNNYPERL